MAYYSMYILLILVFLNNVSKSFPFNDTLFPCDYKLPDSSCEQKDSCVLNVKCSNQPYSHIKDGFQDFVKLLLVDVKRVNLNFSADRILFLENQKMAIQEDFFAGLSLSSVVIRNSNLTKFSINLSAYQNLKHLDISSNSLFNLTAGDFPPKLLCLNLSNNKFEHMRHIQFEGNTIDLSYNKLKSISLTLVVDRTLVDFRESGAKIDLSHNNLKSVSFAAKGSLFMRGRRTVLDLSHNQLQTISLSIDDLYWVDIMDMYLNDNFLDETSFRNHTFTNSKMVQVYHLAHNNFSAIELTPFGAPLLSSSEYKYYKFDFKGNRLQCDCRMYWIYEARQVLQKIDYIEMDLCPNGLTLIEYGPSLCSPHSVECRVEWFLEDKSESVDGKVECFNMTQTEIRSSFKMLLSQNTSINIFLKQKYIFRRLDINSAYLGIEGHLEGDIAAELKFRHISVEASEMKSFDLGILKTVYGKLSFQNNLLQMDANLSALLENKNGLEFVWLNNNNISFLPMKVYGFKLIDLSNNKIEVVNGSTFKNSHTINLSNNKIHTIGRHAFVYDFFATSIDEFHLSLKNNSLDDNSTEKDFIGISFGWSKPKYSTVDLSFNQLTRIDSTFFQILHETNQNVNLIFTNNPLTCGCEIRWVLQFPVAIDLKTISCLNDSQRSKNNEHFGYCRKDRLGPGCKSISQEVACHCYECNGNFKLDCSGEVYSDVKSTFRALRKTSSLINKVDFIGDSMIFNLGSIIESDFFDKVIQIRNFRMRDTNMTGVEPGLFTSEIEIVDLSRNRIISSESLFETIESFRGNKLDLSYNQIRQLNLRGEYIFKYNIIFDFSHNSIETVLVNVLLNERDARSLSIDLSENSIRELTDGSVVIYIPGKGIIPDFAGKKHNISLDFSNNKMERVKRDSLQICGRLITLNFDHNEFDSSSFDKGFLHLAPFCHSIVKLNLRNNSLEFISSWAFKEYMDHKSEHFEVRLDITVNPIRVDCRSEWILYNKTRNHMVTLDHYTRLHQNARPTCVSDMTGVKKSTLDPCKMTDKFHVRCDNITMDKLKTFFDSVTCNLSLLEFPRLQIKLQSSTNGTHLTKYFINFAFFKSISITKSGLESFQRKSFGSSTRYVTHLDLSYNPIDSEDNLFDFIGDMTEIQILVLIYCRLKAITENSFQSLSHLKVLDLSHNLMTVWSQQDFPLINHSFLNINLRNNVFSDDSFSIDSFRKSSDRLITVSVYMEENNLTLGNESLNIEKVRQPGKMYFMFPNSSIATLQFIDEFNIMHGQYIYLFYVEFEETKRIEKKPLKEESHWLRHIAAAAGLSLALTGCLMFIKEEILAYYAVNPEESDILLTLHSRHSKRMCKAIGRLQEYNNNRAVPFPLKRDIEVLVQWKRDMEKLLALEKRGLGPHQM